MRRSLESLGHDTDCLPRFVSRLDANEVPHVEFIRSQRVEIQAFEDEFLSSKHLRIWTAGNTFQIYEESFWGFARTNNAPPDAVNYGFDAFSKVVS